MFGSIINKCLGWKTSKKSVAKKESAAEEHLGDNEIHTMAYTPLRPNKIYPMPTPLRDLVGAC